MLKNGYNPKLATGVITAAGTLGQIIPPSIVLILLGDVISNAYQQSQLKMGIFHQIQSQLVIYLQDHFSRDCCLFPYIFYINF